MKFKIILGVISIITSISTFAQLNTKENTSVGLQFGTIEYNGEYAKEIYSFDTGIHPSLGLNVSRYLSPSFNVRGNFRIGQIDRNVFKAKLLDINVLLDYKFANGYILKENSFFAPYIFIGAGDAISIYTDMNTGIKEEPIAYFNLPMGAGLMFNITPKMSLTLESHFNYTFTDQLDGKISNDTKWDDSFLYNSIGFNYNFSVGKDTDGDGVKDKDDPCPNSAGPINGCPDTDGDGVADKDDTCPNVAGPISGCPDTDGDGVADAKDKCPEIKGTSKDGCPEHYKEDQAVLLKAQKGLFFNTGSSVIKEESFTVLDNVAKLLNKNPKLVIAINGYTDNTGSSELNHKLSKERADAAKAYLIKKGVDESRISTHGYGEESPIADNSTSEGRKQNRRVEFVVKY
jgi:outer membrane protein OmpA-like peptidoglycan-associated protein